MLLKDDVKRILNRVFQNAEFPMLIKEIHIYRPTYFEAYFENIEPINDIERLFECNPIYILANFEYDDREYEYEIRYKNEGRQLETKLCKIKYCDYGEGEDINDIGGRMTPLMSLFSSTLIPNLLNVLYENKKTEG